MEENTPACIFVENLFQFCLEKRGIAWQPAPRDSQIGVADMLFNETIGNAVLLTSSKSPERMRTFTRIVWEYICNTPDPITCRSLYQEIISLGRRIYKSDSTFEHSYVFLAAMVDLAIQCANDGKHKLIQDFVSIVPSVLDSGMPDASKHLGFFQFIRSFTSYGEILLMKANANK